MPEDYLLISKTYLKIFSTNYDKRFTKFAKFIDKNIYDTINKYENGKNIKNSLQGIENTKKIYKYAAEIALIFIHA